MGEETHTRDFVNCIDLLNLLQDFLPENNLKFRQLVDDKGRYYYWNKASGTVSYSRPEGFYTTKQLAKVLTHYFSIAKRENVDFNSTPHGIPFKQPLPPADPPPVDLLIGAKSPTKDNLHQTTPPMKIQSTFRRASKNSFERSKVLSGFRNSNPDTSGTTPPTEIPLGSDNTDSGTESLPQSPVSSSFPSPSSFRIHKVERRSAPPNANGNTLLQSPASSGHLSMPVSASGASGYGIFGSCSDSESSQADSGPASTSPTPRNSNRDSTSSDEQGKSDQDTISQYTGGQDQMTGVGVEQNQIQGQLQSQISFRGRSQMRGGRGMRGSSRCGISVSVGKRMSQSDRLSYDRDEEFEEFEETEMSKSLDGTPTKTIAAMTNTTPTEDAPLTSTSNPSSSTIVSSDTSPTTDNIRSSCSSGSISSSIGSGRGVTMTSTTPRRGGVTTVGKRGGGVTLAFTSNRTNNNNATTDNNTPPNSSNNIGGGSLS